MAKKITTAKGAAALAAALPSGVCASAALLAPEPGR